MGAFRTVLMLEPAVERLAMSIREAGLDATVTTYRFSDGVYKNPDTKRRSKVVLEINGTSIDGEQVDKEYILLPNYYTPERDNEMSGLDWKWKEAKMMIKRELHLNNARKIGE